MMGYRRLLAVMPLLVLATATPFHARRASGRDCGTWTMYCGGVPLPDGSRGAAAEGACNNACYFINIQEAGNFTATVDHAQDPDRSREQSGCQTGAGSAGGSVCNAMPFSQRFHDPFENESDPTRQRYGCAAFPMAAMQQGDFRAGRVRNALRCIPQTEQSSGEQQLQAFVADHGSGLEGRNPACRGELHDGDTYQVAFNYDGADLNKVPYCTTPGNDHPNSSEDAYQFYMTEMRGAQGTLDAPYDARRNNRYAIYNSGADVLQCRVDVRRAGDEYNATVYDVYGTRQGQSAARLGTNDDVLTVPGRGGLNELAVMRTDAMGPAGTQGSPVHFTYGAHGFADFDLVEDFWWGSETTGTAGQYCTVPPIEASADGDAQTITCYFPCLAG